jgi:hypothetical protein
VYVLGPLLRDPLLEADPAAQAEESVELLEVVTQTWHGQPAFGDIAGVTGWGETRQRTSSNSVGNRVIAAKIETAPMHRLKSPIVSCPWSRGVCVRNEENIGCSRVVVHRAL